MNGKKGMNKSKAKQLRQREKIKVSKELHINQLSIC